MRRPNRRKRPNRPHISSDISNVKEREDQIARAASFLTHLAIRASGSLAVTFASATSSDHPCHHVLSASVRRYLGPLPWTRKRKKHPM